MRLIDVSVLKEWVENWFTKNRLYHPYAKNNNIPITELYDILEQMPSAQPEQRKGEWIDEGFYADGHGAHAFRCSECGGHIIEYDADPFCRWCGADMRGEQDE